MDIRRERDHGIPMPNLFLCLPVIERNWRCPIDPQCALLCIWYESISFVVQFRPTYGDACHSFTLTHFRTLTLAYGGKTLILAGGRSLTGLSTYDDVFSFDVATSKWSKLANAPRPAWGHVCAVSGDLFIYWGGVDTSKDDINTSNHQGPAVLNIVSNTWGTGYAPPGQTPPSSSPSSADRPHMVLSKVGLAALTLISIAASTLIL